MVVIDIVDGCDWYRQWLRLISKIIDIDRWYVDIDIVDGWDWYRRLLLLIGGMLILVSSMVEIIDIDIVDGCDGQ